MSGSLFIVRHGETVFNAASRMQGDVVHTPLTRAGFAQAEAMGAALRRRLGPKPKLDLWASPAGRALQTLAVIAEQLELDWHQARTDPRLSEIGIGEWSGHYYRDLVAKSGEIVDPETGLFCVHPADGESYGEVAERLRSWLAEHDDGAGDRLIVMHGLSGRILRGILTGAAEAPGCGVPVGERVPQGRVSEIRDGVETLLEPGDTPAATDGGWNSGRIPPT